MGRDHRVSAGLWVILAWLVLLGFNVANGAPLTARRLGDTALMTVGIFVLNLGINRIAYRFPAWIGWIVWGSILAVWIGSIFFQWENSLVASLFLVVGFASFQYFTRWLLEETRTVIRWLAYLGMSLVIGCVTVALNQIQIRFSEEEFFSAIQAVQLAIYWFLLSQTTCLIHQKNVAGRDTLERTEANRKERARRRQLATGLFALSLLAFGFLILIIYQNSFYGNTVPEYPGITEDEPYRCSQIPASTQSYSTEKVRSELIQLIEAKPDKATPDLAFLALVKEDITWAEQFRERLLSEVRQRTFTGPVYSVKYGQCLAARRAYFYPLVKQQFPDLFSPQEIGEITSWFRAINRRALTVEPIDWFYAIAFRYWPEGPYENQECGAGLLSVLEVNDLADPKLSKQNTQYLTQHPRGWEKRFRNNDDTYIYQIEWMQNVYFQSLYTKKIEPNNLIRSFEWALFQSLPDGDGLGYNQIGSAPALQTAYWGATLLGRPEFIWLAGRSAETLKTQAKSANAIAGLEKQGKVGSEPPTWGSCLLFGQTGLPTRIGPLAPDKIVFRDGWETEAQYLLLNLRFTGWHRYKATNTVVLLNQDGLLLGEDNRGEAFAWLPKGRSLFRDKRIPRQNLNGLLVARRGLDAVLYRLTGLKGFWAQDPPFYADVSRFEVHQNFVLSETKIEGWHGWQQRRTVYFYNNGPVIILDQVTGPPNQQAAVSWHMREGTVQITPKRYMLRSGEKPAEMVLLSLDVNLNPAQIAFEPGGDGKMSALTYQPNAQSAPGPVEFALATVILTRGWTGATLNWDSSQSALTVCQGEQCLETLLPDHSK